jgi:hypothetical protein
MAPLSSGDNNLEIWDAGLGWIHIAEAYLTEAAEYKLRYTGEKVDVRIQEVPLPFYQEEGVWFATFLTPFQSGTMRILVNNQVFDTYIYPDQRKLTEEQYNLMIEEILKEANTCFQLCGMEMKVNTAGKSRGISWTQWSYIERSFQQIRQIFSKIEKQPIRRLVKQTNIMKREKVQRTEQVTLAWLDKRGHGRDIPTHVETNKTFETRDVYENQVLKQQVQGLCRLLRKYETTDVESVAYKAKRYKSILLHWIKGPFLSEVTENEGSYNITQTFRKHPVYRLWYEWFDKLYSHNREGIGLSYPIALKDTYFLYEMWCYMNIIKILRESGLVKDTKNLFRTSRQGLFLHLSENNESSIELVGGLSLYFQRVYQNNTKLFHTYTQRMIPDIVLEGPNGIIVLDPKYRVPGNIGTALGEMHKYRDGIIDRLTGERAVKEVYILTPTTDGQADGLRFFGEEFHEKYRMGSIRMLPGVNSEDMRGKILSWFEHLVRE